MNCRCFAASSIFFAMHICDSAFEASACFTRLNDLKTSKGSSMSCRLRLISLDFDSDVGSDAGLLFSYVAGPLGRALAGTRR